MLLPLALQIEFEENSKKLIYQKQFDDSWSNQTHYIIKANIEGESHFNYGGCYEIGSVWAFILDWLCGNQTINSLLQSQKKGLFHLMMFSYFCTGCKIIFLRVLIICHQFQTKKYKHFCTSEGNNAP